MCTGGGGEDATTTGAVSGTGCGADSLSASRLDMDMGFEILGGGLGGLAATAGDVVVKGIPLE